LIILVEENNAIMPTWMAIANGPIFRFTLVILVLGLLRLTLLTIWEIVVAIRNAGDHRLPYVQIVQQTLSWFFPIKSLYRSRGSYSLASFVMHAGVVLIILFLRNHIEILQANMGISWLAISKPILDWLTLASIGGGIFLLFYRVYVTSSRTMSKAVDYLVLVLILDIFISGYLAGRAWNPVPYDGLMLFHVLNGIILLLLIPFTKIAHCVLFPLVRLGSEVAWHLRPEAGNKVVQTLYGSQERKI
jgi:nitrate reductase gamma subunit